MKKAIDLAIKLIILISFSLALTAYALTTCSNNIDSLPISVLDPAMPLSNYISLFAFHRLIYVSYDTSTNYITGRITETDDPCKFAVIVYIRQNDDTLKYSPKPNEFEAIQPIKQDGSFEVCAYGYGANENIDKSAKYFSVLLVYADLNYSDLRDTAYLYGIDTCDIIGDYAIDAIWDMETGNNQVFPAILSEQPLQPFPAPFVLLSDDGAELDVCEDIAYMGMENNGDDGSITVNAHDTSQSKVGNASMKFTYTPPSDTNHWAAVALLFSQGDFMGDPGRKGPDLKLYTKLTFWVKGHGGTVKFFIECDGGAQSSTNVTVVDEWQLVELHLDKSWSYCNIMFGWACNESNPDSNGGTIEFWCDGMQFE